MKEHERQTVHQEVTDRISADLEQERVPWLQPWARRKSGSGCDQNLHRSEENGKYSNFLKTAHANSAHQQGQDNPILSKPNAHNLKVAGSNPAPATIRNGANTTSWRRFLIIFQRCVPALGYHMGTARNQAQAT